MILRNAETSAGALFTFALMSFDKKAARMSTSRVALFSAAVLYSSLFALAGLFTSFVDIGPTVLFKNTPGCASSYHTIRLFHTNYTLGKDDGTEASGKTAVLNDYKRGHLEVGYELNRTSDTNTYLQECFASDGTFIKTGGYGCAELYNAFIPFSKSRVDCPFKNTRINACNPAYEKEGLALETERISLSKLGFNEKDFAKISFAKRTECSPLAAQPFLYSLDQILKDPDATDQDRAIIRTLSSQNASDTLTAFALSELGENNTHIYFDFVAASGTLMTDIISDTEDSCIPPVCPEKEDMPLSIITVHIPASMTFPREIRDAFFQTKKPSEQELDTLVRRQLPEDDLDEEDADLGDGDLDDPDAPPSKEELKAEKALRDTIYKAAYPINPIACTEKVMYCSELTNYCTPWTGASAGIDLDADSPSTDDESFEFDEEHYTDLVHRLFPNPKSIDPAMKEAIYFLTDQITESPLGTITNLLGFSSLRASRTQNSQTSSLFDILDNQWELEVENWFRVAVTRIWRALVRLFGNNEWRGDLKKVLKTDEFEEGRMSAMCSVIRFNSADHSTFSMTGIILILVFTALCTALSFVPWGIGKLYVRKKRVFGWEEDDAVEMLREGWKREGSNSGSPVVEAANVKGEKGELETFQYTLNFQPKSPSSPYPSWPK